MARNPVKQSATGHLASGAVLGPLRARVNGEGAGSQATLSSAALGSTPKAKHTSRVKSARLSV